MQRVAFKSVLVVVFATAAAVAQLARVEPELLSELSLKSQGTNTCTLAFNERLSKLAEEKSNIKSGSDLRRRLLAAMQVEFCRKKEKENLKRLVVELREKPSLIELNFGERQEGDEKSLVQINLSEINSAKQAEEILLENKLEITQKSALELLKFLNSQQVGAKSAAFGDLTRLIELDDKSTESDCNLSDLSFLVGKTFKFKEYNRALWRYVQNKAANQVDACRRNANKLSSLQTELFSKETRERLLSLAREIDWHSFAAANKLAPKNWHKFGQVAEALKSLAENGLAERSLFSLDEFAQLEGEPLVEACEEFRAKFDESFELSELICKQKQVDTFSGSYGKVVADFRQIREMCSYIPRVENLFAEFKLNSETQLDKIRPNEDEFVFIKRLFNDLKLVVPDDLLHSKQKVAPLKVVMRSIRGQVDWVRLQRSDSISKTFIALEEIKKLQSICKQYKPLRELPWFSQAGYELAKFNERDDSILKDTLIVVKTCGSLERIGLENLARKYIEQRSIFRRIITELTNN